MSRAIRTDTGSGPRAQPEPAEHEHGALAQRAARGQHPELDGAVVGVEERPDAPQPAALGVELAVADDMGDEEAAARRQLAELAAVRAEHLARRREVAPVGQALAGALDARVREQRPQLRRVVGDRVGPVERLAAQRVLVVDVGRAHGVERGAVTARPRRLPAVDQVVDRLRRAHCTGGVRSARPSSGVEASACSRRGIRPAPRASRPASTAARIAWAMATGSWARAIALAHSTPSQPSSIASAASLAVPTPASRITGTFARSTISEMLYGLRIPMPEPIGEPSGMTAAQPTSSRRRARIGSSFVYGRTVKPSATSSSAASSSSGASGSSVRSSPITSSLTQSVPNASRASFAVTTASRAVKQPAVFGNSSTPHSSRTSVSEPRACGSIRRSAIVTSSAPVARIASASVSRRLNPPVPRMSRERSVRPPTSNGVSVTGICSVLTGSASLHGGQRLDALALVDAARGPLGARDDLAVDRDGDAAGARLDAEVREQL